MGDLQNDYPCNRVYIFCKTSNHSNSMKRVYSEIILYLNQGLIDSVNQSHSHLLYFAQFYSFSHGNMREEIAGSENLVRKLGEFKAFPVLP